MDSNPVGHVQKSAWQRLSVLPIGVWFVLQTVYRTALSVVPRTREGWPFRRTLGVSFVQSAIHVFESRRNPEDVRWSTAQVVENYSKKRQIPFTRIGIDCGPFHDDAFVYEFAVPSLDSRDGCQAKRVVLYAHGGGYGNPPIPAHLTVALSLCRSVQAQDLFFLGYRIAPFAQYPTQLVQAIEALRHLLEIRRIRAQDIVLAGDSAGGNLVMAVLAHLKSPSPYVAALPKCSLLAVAAISPWAAVHEVDGPSAKYAGREDYIFIWHGRMLLDIWKPQHEVWAELVSRTTSNLDGFWKSDLPVKHLVITSGTWEASYSAHELLASSCNAFKIEVGYDGQPTDSHIAHELGKAETRTFIVGLREVHVTAGVDSVMGLKENGSFLALKGILEHI